MLLSEALKEGKARLADWPNGKFVYEGPLGHLWLMAHGCSPAAWSPTLKEAIATNWESCQEDHVVEFLRAELEQKTLAAKQLETENERLRCKLGMMSVRYG
jgi:ferredoxin-NADP reductase